MMDSIQAVSRGYDRWSSVYDDEANPLVAMEGPRVREMVGSPAGPDVLDLGCGTARHALWLASRGANVVAIDFSEGMLAKARSKPGADRVRFLSHDLHEPLPLADSKFDLVVSGLVLEHLRELEPFFREARRVLKPTGRAIISAMHPAMFLRGTAARFTDPLSGEVVQPGSIAHSVSDFVMAALHGGFAIASSTEFVADAQLAIQYPRAAKYVDWPMLFLMSLTAAGPVISS